MDSMFNMAVILTAVDHFSGPMRGIAKTMTDFDQLAQRGQAWQVMGQRITVAGALTQGAASVMQRGLASVLQPARDVEEALAMVGTVIAPMAGTVEDALGRVKREALDWSKAHQDSADDFIRTTYMMISAGLDERAAIEATKTSMGVATATMGESTEAANLMAVVYNNMGDATKDARQEMARIGDTLAKTQQTFQFANLNQLTEGMKYAIPTALTYGNSLEEISVVMGGLNNAGLQGGQAGTAWSATMRNMTKASRDLRFEVARTSDGGVDFIATLANIEAKYGSIKDLSPQVQEKFKTAFGDEGLRAISLLLGKSGELSQQMLDVADASGTVAEAQSKLEQSGNAGMKILTNNIAALKASIGDVLIPRLNALLPKVVGVVDAVAGFADANPGLVETGMILFGIGTAVLTVIAPILTVVGAVITVSGAAMSAIGVIGAGLTWLWPKILLATTGVFRFGSAIVMTAARAVPWLLSGVARLALAMGGQLLIGARLAIGAIGTATMAMFRFGASMVAIAARSVARLLVGLGQVALAMGGQLLTGIRSAIGAFRALGVAMMANPIGLVVGAIALAAGLIYLYWEPIAGFFSNLWGRVTGAFEGFMSWLPNWWGRLQTDTGGAIGELMTLFLRFTPVGMIRTGLAEAADLLAQTEWGSYAIDIVKGLAAGFSSAMGEVIAPVTEIASGIKTRFKSLLGIESPSKVFRGFGGDLVAGLNQGILGNRPGAMAQAAALAAGVVSSATVALPAVTAQAATPLVQNGAISTPAVATPARALLATGPRAVDLPPASSRRPEEAGVAGGQAGGSGGGQIVINFSPTITVTGDGRATEESIRDALRGLGADLARIVADAQDRAGRTRY